MKFLYSLAFSFLSIVSLHAVTVTFSADGSNVSTPVLINKSNTFNLNDVMYMIKDPCVCTSTPGGCGPCPPPHRGNCCAPSKCNTCNSMMTLTADANETVVVTFSGSPCWIYYSSPPPNWVQESLESLTVNLTSGQSQQFNITLGGGGNCTVNPDGTTNDVLTIHAD